MNYQQICRRKLLLTVEMHDFRLVRIRPMESHVADYCVIRL